MQTKVAIRLYCGVVYLFGISDITFSNGQLVFSLSDETQKSFEVNLSGNKEIEDVSYSNGVMTFTFSDSTTKTCNIEFGPEGDITVDSTWIQNSTNPVQSKVIKEELDKKTDNSDLADVAFSGSYNDLTDKPTITPGGGGSSVEIVDDLETNDSTKALSAAQGRVLQNSKADKESGKGLSQNSYTDREKDLVATIVNKANASDVANTYATKEELDNAQFGDGGEVDLSGYVKTSDISDNLTTDDAEKVLSAKQGKNLQDNKTDKTNGASQITDSRAYSNIGSSANATQATINNKIDSFIYGNSQAILEIERELLGLSNELNSLEGNLADFNDALLDFDGDTTTARDNLSKLKQNLEAILGKITDLQNESGEFSEFLTEFQPKLNTLDLTLSALYQGLTNFEGTLNDFEADLRSQGININQLDNGIVSLLELIFDSKESIKAVEDDIGNANTPGTLWYHITQINNDLDDSISGSLANLVKEAKNIIGDPDNLTSGTVLYDIDRILNTDIPNLQALMYGTGKDSNNQPYSSSYPKEGTLFYQINYIQNTSLVNLRTAISEAKQIADEAKDQADTVSRTIVSVQGDLWGTGSNNDKSHPSDGSILGRLGIVEGSVSTAESSLWGNGNQTNPQAGSLWARLKAIYNPDNNTGSLVDLENDINNTVMYSIFCINKNSTVENPVYFVPPGVPVWICVQAIVHGEDAPLKSQSEIPITITDSNNNTFSLQYNAYGTGNLSGLYIYEYTPSTTGILTIACFNQRTTLHVTGTAPSVNITDITSTIFTQNSYSPISTSTSLQAESYIDFYHDDETRLCELYFSAYVDVDNTTGIDKWGNTGWSVPSAYAPKRDLYCHDTSNPNHLALIRSASSSTTPLAIQGLSKTTEGVTSYSSNHTKWKITFHAMWTY